MNKFLETVTSKLAESWISQVLSPAFVFWSGGWVLWAWRHEDGSTTETVSRWRNEWDDTSLIVAAILFLLVVVVSGTLVQRLALPILRLLEGYWPKWLGWLRSLLVSRQLDRKQQLEREWETAAVPVHEGSATPTQWDRYIQLDEMLRRFPSRPAVMPTALGNTLRAGELRPRERRGIDPTVCWVYLWLVLPDSARAELNSARGELDGAAVAFTWAALFLVWTVWSPWVPLAALLAAALIHKAMVMPAARSWSDLVEAAVEIYTPKLADAMRLPAATTIGDQKKQGDFVTRYLQGRKMDPNTKLATGMVTNEECADQP